MGQGPRGLSPGATWALPPGVNVLHDLGEVPEEDPEGVGHEFSGLQQKGPSPSLEDRPSQMALVLLSIIGGATTETALAEQGLLDD